LNEAERTLIRYRLERARETLADAELLPNQNRLPAAANRIYCAMFYAAVALQEARRFAGKTVELIGSLE